MTPRPRFYEGILIMGDGRSGTVARVGGLWAQPNLALSYLLSARVVIERHETEGRISRVGLPVAYLQRHAFELALKDVLDIAFDIRRDGQWLMALETRDPTAASLPAPSGRQKMPDKHHLPLLAGLARSALTSLGPYTLPDALVEMAKHLDVVEASEPTRTRYLRSLRGDMHFATATSIEVVATQERLEAVFGEHLVFDAHADPAQANLVTSLAHEAEAVFQGLQRYVPIDEL